MLEPIPFRLRLPKRSEFNWLGIEEAKSRIDALLHFEENTLILEWQEHEKRDKFGFLGIGTEHETFPAEAVEIPVEWIAEVRVLDFGLAAWVRLRARRLDAFDGIPGVHGGVLTLRVGLLHRHTIAPMVAAIREARGALGYQAPTATRRLPAVEDE